MLKRERRASLSQKEKEVPPSSKSHEGGGERGRGDGGILITSNLGGGKGRRRAGYGIYLLDTKGNRGGNIKGEKKVLIS